jgi:cytosine/adenosine deaminase-related metal-dependent hydrolase
MEYAAKSIRAKSRDANAITPDDLIRAASIGGAAALRLDDLGSLEIGKRADFVLLRFPSLGAPSATERKAWIAHRVEPENIVGRFYKGRWLASAEAEEPKAFG